MLEVRVIPLEMTYPLRNRVLRPHQTVEDCKYDTDTEKDTFHVGAFLDGELISVVSFCTEKNPDFPEEKQYRLRAMATLEEHRKVGAGRAAVTFGEEEIKKRGCRFLWCKGRTSVQAYYERLGFQSHGEVFDYPPIGLHITMIKRL